MRCEKEPSTQPKKGERKTFTYRRNAAAAAARRGRRWFDAAAVVHQPHLWRNLWVSLNQGINVLHDTPVKVPQLAILKVPLFRRVLLATNAGALSMPMHQLLYLSHRTLNLRLGG